MLINLIIFILSLKIVNRNQKRKTLINFFHLLSIMKDILKKDNKKFLN